MNSGPVSISKLIRLLSMATPISAGRQALTVSRNSGALAGKSGIRRCSVATIAPTELRDDDARRWAERRIVAWWDIGVTEAGQPPRIWRRPAARRRLPRSAHATLLAGPYWRHSTRSASCRQW